MPFPLIYSEKRRDFQMPSLARSSPFFSRAGRSVYQRDHRQQHRSMDEDLDGQVGRLCWCWGVWTELHPPLCQPLYELRRPTMQEGLNPNRWAALADNEGWYPRRDEEVGDRVVNKPLPVLPAQPAAFPERGIPCGLGVDSPQLSNWLRRFGRRNYTIGNEVI